MRAKTLATEYAVYKGEKLLVMGTLRECAENLGLKPESIRFLSSSAYQKRMEAKNGKGDYKIAVRLDDGD
jgi:hypothetical protein